MSALSTPIHEQLEQKKRRREKQGVQPNNQKPKKSQNQVI
jgi:hypothetical protein